MNEVQNSPTSNAKKRQMKLWIAIFIGFGIIALLLWFIGRENEVPPKNEIKDAAPVYDVTRAIDDKSYWIFKSEKKLEEQEKKQDEILKDINDIRASINKSNDEKRKVLDMEQELKTIKEEVAEFKKKMETKPNQANEGKDKLSNEAKDQYFPSQEVYGGMVGMGSRLAPSIFTETITLQTHPNERKKSHHIENYIPAGSFAKAALLSGVDVSAGVSSQTNPKPVLLRLISKGNLPNKCVGSMRDCRIIAAAYGDLSSERAYLRLEKLSCIERDGTIIETDVDGYVSGEDGKNGMRGNVVIRDGEVLKRGFLGGLFSGLGKATTQTLATTSVSPLGATSTIKSKDVFKSAGSEGVGDAFELMARYNIQRAEQYQPVIQISAGRIVDVVFHSGSQFGEKKTRKKEEKMDVPKVGNIFGE